MMPRLLHAIWALVVIAMIVALLIFNGYYARKTPRRLQWYVSAREPISAGSPIRDGMVKSRFGLRADLQPITLPGNVSPIGRYVSTTRRMGDPLLEDELKTVPPLEASKGMVLIPIRVRADGAPLLVVGGRVSFARAPVAAPTTAPDKAPGSVVAPVPLTPQPLSIKAIMPPAPDQTQTVIVEVSDREAVHFADAAAMTTWIPIAAAP